LAVAEYKPLTFNETSALPVQEIVFIGAAMDRAAIEAQLDGALLSDKGAPAAAAAGC
jgi:hypothetical protein